MTSTTVTTTMRAVTQDRYGENLATFGTTAASNFYTPEQAVDSWMSEKACWDYGTPYVITLKKGTDGVTYAIATRKPGG